MGGSARAVNDRRRLMWGLADEQAFWEKKVVDAHHNPLDVVQAAASKWQVAISAFLGVYATAGFVLGTDKLSTWPLHGFLEDLSLAAIVGTGLIGVIAIAFANFAAQGIPRIQEDVVVTASEMYAMTINRAKSAHRQLFTAIVLAGIAGFLAIGTSTWVLIAGVQSNQTQSNNRMTLPPATASPAVDECSRPLNVTSSGVVGPIYCVNGGINVRAWFFYAGSGPIVMSIGSAPSFNLVFRSMCADSALGKVSDDIETIIERLSARYYGWRFPIDFGLTYHSSRCPVIRGPRGFPGPQGQPGLRGPKGDKGDPGSPATTTPTVMGMAPSAVSYKQNKLSPHSLGAQ